MDRVDYQSMIIQDLLNDHEADKLDLNPWYQRRSVWSDAQKSYLINTLFERKPVPTIYVRHGINLEQEKSYKEVVDGQQRCRAIIDYKADKFAARYPGVKNKKKYSELTPAEKNKFLLTPIPFGFLLGANDADVIDIFARINSVSKTLNTQEKLNARYSGEFKQFCVKLSSRYVSFWKNTGIFTSNDIARMSEVAFISDVVYNVISGLSDYRPADIERTYKKYDDIFPSSDEIDTKISLILESLANFPTELFSTTIFKRQPLFFSLVMVLISLGKTPKNIESVLYDIDALFNDESIIDPEVLDFRKASGASTQRFASRSVRDKFLRKRLT